MPTETLTARVARLEQTVAELVSKLEREPAPDDDDDDQSMKYLHRSIRDDWKKVVGMFDGDKVMERIDARGAAIRRAERRKARRG